MDRREGLGEAETWIDRMRSVHVDQIHPADSAMGYSPKQFKILVVLMSIALLATIVIGVVQAFRSIHQRGLVCLSLGLGIALPTLLLWIGQKR